MAKTKQTKRMMTMALAAAVAMSAVPTVAFATEGAPAEQSESTGGETAATQTGRETDPVTGNTTTTVTERTGDAKTSDDGQPVDNGGIKVTTTVTDADNNVVDVDVTEVKVDTDTATKDIKDGNETAVKITTTIRTETITETDDGEGAQTSVTVTAKPDKGVVSEVVGEVTETVTNNVIGEGEATVTIETKTEVDREVSMEVKASETTEEADAVITEVTLVVKDQADLSAEASTEDEAAVEGETPAESTEPVEDTRNTDADHDNDVYNAEITIKVEVKEDGTTRVSVYQGGEQLGSQDVGKGTTDVTFDNLKLQENQKIDIKLENLGAVQNDSVVTVQNTADTAGVSMAFDVNEDNKTVVKTATRTFRRTVSEKIVDKTHIHKADEGTAAFTGKNITVYIYGEQYNFAASGNKWTMNEQMNHLNIPGGKHGGVSIPVVIKWVENGKTYICTADLVNHDNDKVKNGTQNYKFANVQEVETELPKDPTNPEFKVPTVPAIPLQPAIPTVPATPLQPAIPTVPATPLQPAIPTVPATPLQPAIPTVPATPLQPAIPTVPATPSTPTTPDTPDTPSRPNNNRPSRTPIVENIFEEEVPLADLELVDEPMIEEVVIGEEDVPLASAPEEDPMVLGAEEEGIIAGTGDSNHMAAGFGGMFAALAGMLFCRKRKEN